MWLRETSRAHAREASRLEAAAEARKLDHSAAAAAGTARRQRHAAAEEEFARQQQEEAAARERQLREREAAQERLESRRRQLLREWRTGGQDLEQRLRMPPAEGTPDDFVGTVQRLWDRYHADPRAPPGLFCPADRQVRAHLERT